MALFSVIIPTFNRASLVLDAVKSVFEQTCRDFEVIVVDDGSTDETAEVLSRSGYELRYIWQENMGAGAARNRGVVAATGEIVAFLDSDDVWFPWALETYKCAFGYSDKVSWVAGTGIDFREISELSRVGRAEYRQRAFTDYLSTASEGIWIGTCACAIRRDVFLSVGGFVNHKFCAEDSDLWLKLGVAPGFVSIQEPVVFAYRRHFGSAVGDVLNSAKGLRHLIDSEILRSYPGGRRCARKRREIITRHVRPVSLDLGREGFSSESLVLFLRTFFWNLSLLRIRYLVGYPVALLSGLRKKRVLG